MNMSRVSTRIPVEDLKVGDSVFDASGNAVRVTSMRPYEHPSIETPAVLAYGPGEFVIVLFLDDMVEVAS